MTEILQLGLNHVVIFHRIRASAAIRDIHDVRQQSSTLNVAQELGAEACAKMRSLNQAGDIGDDKALFIRPLAHGDNAQIWFQRGKWIIGNLRSCGGDASDQSGLANVGMTHQADIGEQLQLQPKQALFTGETSPCSRGA